ncbi:hypothetical protein PUNSTDRAFT_58448 [Punctularia strigosozonata HHB-11173 SS5]|uniref:uncharacterized protein n=1 Tax=Punctularia strigosozonata (strain HHB-11173) TaxID=741275 RepID=UPI0004417D78|nr:uncharacterized protein PUNSTDRAFT_58448 [Punctularia strigosozonata HHB-11173 SS5]EIN13968.1 hypothetical protein PUNSTDRAFT_58448 [Punctularia strigosozonata HHB-11173 SS5]
MRLNHEGSPSSCACCKCFKRCQQIITTPETSVFTFEATLLLSLLCNYHKPEASKLNPYVQRLKKLDDSEIMQKIYWSTNFALNAAVKAYQDILPDESPTMLASVGTFLATMRLDRAPSPTTAGSARRALRNHPIEGAAIAFALLDLIRENHSFSSFVVTHAPSDNRIAPLPQTVLSLSSYVLTHASSSMSDRALAYAQLTMNIMFTWSGDVETMRLFCGPSTSAIRLCRQREPRLPQASVKRPLVCAMLDCSSLWLRHNLRKRLDVVIYR